jgi:hypothetical protein
MDRDKKVVGCLCAFFRAPLPVEQSRERTWAVEQCGTWWSKILHNMSGGMWNFGGAKPIEKNMGGGQCGFQWNKAH